jgi:hypothetical protein
MNTATEYPPLPGEPEGWFKLDPEIEALVGELKALAAQYPPPTREEVMADWKWVYERSDDGTLNPDWKYKDGVVAVYNHEIVGSGPNYLRLQIDLSRKFGVHPERFVIVTMP